MGETRTWATHKGKGKGKGTGSKRKPIEIEPDSKPEDDDTKMEVKLDSNDSYEGTVGGLAGSSSSQPAAMVKR